MIQKPLWSLRRKGCRTQGTVNYLRLARAQKCSYCCLTPPAGVPASQPAGHLAERLKLNSLKGKGNPLKWEGSLIYSICEETMYPLTTQNYLHIFQYLFWELFTRMTARYSCWVRCLYYHFVSDLTSLCDFCMSEPQETSVCVCV